MESYIKAIINYKALYMKALKIYILAFIYKRLFKDCIIKPI